MVNCVWMCIETVKKQAKKMLTDVCVFMRSHQLHFQIGVYCVSFLVWDFSFMFGLFILCITELDLNSSRLGQEVIRSNRTACYFFTTHFKYKGPTRILQAQVKKKGISFAVFHVFVRLIWLIHCSFSFSVFIILSVFALSSLYQWPLKWKHLSSLPLVFHLLITQPCSSSFLCACSSPSLTLFHWKWSYRSTWALLCMAIHG